MKKLRRFLETGTNRRLLIAIILATTAAAIFAAKKATLGIDFTDEGLYMSAPLRLIHGETLFSSEILTLTRPFELISQIFFRLFQTPSLYQIRLCGWTVHIAVYVTFFVILQRESKSLLLAASCAATPFFISFAWPTTIATPNYRSLSSDLLLLSLLLFHRGVRGDSRFSALFKCAAGGGLAIAIITHPAQIIVGFIIIFYELCIAFRRTCRPSRIRLANMGTTVTLVVAGLLTIAYLAATGALIYWWTRIPMAQNFSLLALRQNRMEFFVSLFHDLFTKIAPFKPYCFFTSFALLATLCTPTALLKIVHRGITLFFFLYSGKVMLSLYQGDDYLSHFFFPTSYCLVGFASAAMYIVASIRGLTTAGPGDCLCILLSLVSTLVYSASTFFFDYYYSWNVGILGLTFAFFFSVNSMFGQKREGAFSHAYGALLMALAVVAARYNYYGVRRDAPVQKLTAEFHVPALRGIRSSPERVQAVEAVYAYMSPRLAADRRLLVYDDCPMLYFVLNADQVYGLGWAMNEYLSPATHELLVREFTRNLPVYVIRTQAKIKTEDWSGAPREPYSADYLLDHTVNSLYDVEHVIYPFEILVRKKSLQN